MLIPQSSRVDSSAQQHIYDVFLSHHSGDKPEVEALAVRLEDEEGVKPFLDKWHLIPGEPWAEALEEALDQSKTCAVFLGPGGLGPWENEEMRVALDERVSNKSFRVIPVLLPGAEPKDKKTLPRFLRRLTWVDFRTGIDKQDAFNRLVAGIQGKKPGRQSSNSKQERKVQWVLVLSGTIEDMDKARVEAIVTHLHQLSEDMTLTIQKIEEGSVKLIIESTEEGFKRIKALYRGADLREVAGRSVLEIRDAQSLVRTRMAQENPSSPMPKSTNKPRNPDDDPAVLAARINRSSAIRAGFIAAAAAVLVAIVGLTSRSCDQQSKLGSDKEKLVIKVLDKSTGRSIGGAKVSLESGDVPPVNTTDSNGVISFPLSNPNKELRIRVEADGYEKDFNLRITPASIIGTQEVRLTPLASPSPTATTAITTQTPNPAPHRSPLPIPIPNKPESSRLVIRGLVMDETGATLPGARVTIAGQGSTTTDASGNFQIAIAAVRGRMIYLNVAKEGYRTKTLEEQASDDAIQILLRR